MSALAVSFHLIDLVRIRRCLIAVARMTEGGEPNSRKQ